MTTHIPDKGILIMPLSTNGASMRNVLEVLYSQRIQATYSLPAVNTICFLRSSDSVTIDINGKAMPCCEAIDILMEDIDPDAQIRFARIREYATEVPEIILKAAKEVGKSKLILDLTAGKKDITGSLYTSACLAEIENTIYVDVHRDPDARTFFTIRRDDPKILEKVNVIKFKSISEIEKLASLNMKDFIFYKKYLETVVPAEDEATLLQFQNAIASYFKREPDSYRNCIRDIGLINENVLSKLVNYLRSYTCSCVKADKPDLITLYAAQQRYEKIVRESPIALDSDDDRKLTTLFSHFPACFEMISMIRNYRNLVSHNKGFIPCKDDAKLVLDTMLRILKSLSDAKVY